MSTWTRIPALPLPYCVTLNHSPDTLLSVNWWQLQHLRHRAVMITTLTSWGS